MPQSHNPFTLRDAKLLVTAGFLTLVNVSVRAGMEPDALFRDNALAVTRVFLEAEGTCKKLQGREARFFVVPVGSGHDVMAQVYDAGKCDGPGGLRPPRYEIFRYDDGRLTTRLGIISF